MADKITEADKNTESANKTYTRFKVKLTKNKKRLGDVSAAINSRYRKLSRRRILAVFGLMTLLTLGVLGAANDPNNQNGNNSDWGIWSTITSALGLTDAAESANTAEAIASANGSLQLSKEYIYAGSRMLAIEDYGLASGSSPTPTPSPTATPLGAPSTLAAPTLNVISQTQIDVYWNASPAGENVASYKLRINGHYEIPGITYLSYPATGLTPGTNYTFEVAAVNSSGVSSAWSPASSATTQSNAPTPSVPTGIVVQTYSSTQLNVFWDAAPSSENVASYKLRVDGSQIISGITYLSFPVTGLLANTTHSFEVAAVNSTGMSSAWSSPASATTAAAPSAPTITQVDVISSTQINVYWSGAQAGENVAGYNVRMNGSQVLTGFTYLSFPFSGLSPSTTYTFQVQAVDAAGGVSAWSTEASATTTP